MASRKPLTDEAGEVRELSREDLARGVPFSALPESLVVSVPVVVSLELLDSL